MLLSTDYISLSHIYIATTHDRWQTEIKTEEEDNIRVCLFIQLLTTFHFSQRFALTALKHEQQAIQYCQGLQLPLPAKKLVTYKIQNLCLRVLTIMANPSCHPSDHLSMPSVFTFRCSGFFTAAQPFIFLSTHATPHSTEKICKFEFNPTNNCR